MGEITGNPKGTGRTGVEQTFCQTSVESGQGALDLFSPLSGEVIRGEKSAANRGLRISKIAFQVVFRKQKIKEIAEVKTAFNTSNFIITEVGENAEC